MRRETKVLRLATLAQHDTLVSARALFFLVFAVFAVAKAETTQSHCAMAVGWVPVELLERPTTLQSGIGNVHEQVTAKAKPDEAQRFYDQGLNYVYDFVWIEAARSFHQALRLDPKMAMAWVGLSRTYLGLLSPAEAQAAAAEAVKLAPGVNALDQVKVRLWATILQASDKPDDAVLQKKMIEDADAALTQYPRDVQLWMMRAAAEPSEAASIAFYDRALNIHANDTGALHLRMHAKEDIGEVQDAVRDGQVLSQIVWAVPHAHHMYGHELRRAGRNQEAIEQFKQAEALELAYYKAQNIAPEYDWHHMHNLNLLASAYLHEGEVAEAEKTLRESVATPSLTVQYAVFKADWPEFLLLRGRNQEALAAARSLTREKWPQPQVIGHALAGEALLALQDRKQAGVELETAEELMKKNQQETQGIRAYVETLAAEMLLGTPQAAEGIAQLQAIESHFAEAKSPDQWNQNLFQMERIARMARETHAWDLAEFSARQMLAMDPYYGGAHFALALAEQQEGQRVKARAEFKEAAQCWSHADASMPELRQSVR